MCYSASGGRGFLDPELDKNGDYKVEHYRTKPKNGAHCFFGAAR